MITNSTELHFRYQADDVLNNLLARLDIKLLEIGYSPRPMSWKALGFNCDPWFRIYYFTERSGFLLIKDNRIELQPGMLHLIPPRYMYRYDISDLAPHVWVHFYSDTLQQYLPSQIYSIPFDNEKLLKDILNTVEVPNPAQPEYTLDNHLRCRQLLQAFFANTAFTEHLSFSSIPQNIRRTAEYIRANFRDNISIGELAQMARLNSVQFSRMFAKYYHVPPKEYHSNIRIDNAKFLLMQTDMSTKEIAEECGFSDCYHFYHFFKKATTLTPSNYRDYNKIVHEKYGSQ